jgi:YNFM family putative membrane transporter
MTARFGRGPVMLVSTGVMLLGLLMTLFSSLWLIFAGMLLFSAGFFARIRLPAAGLPTRSSRQRPGLIPVLVQLLSGIQYRRDARRCVLA